MPDHSSVSHERLHALDALRASMMLLGVVFHVSLYYVSTPGISVNDPLNTTFLADLLGFVIHSFRMPVFFVIAGFFTCLLYRRRGLSGMMTNRMVRIGMPFVVGMIILSPLLSLAYSIAITYPPDSSPPQRTLWQVLVPGNLMHLWFLLLLLCFYVIVAFLDRVSGKLGSFVPDDVVGKFQYLMARPVLRVLVLSFFCAFILLPINGNIGTPAALVPNLETGVMTVFYFVFFAVGWLLYLNRDMLPGYVRGAWLNIALGLVTLFFLLACYVVFGARGLLGTAPVNMIIALLNGLTSWLVFFGLLGIFLRYLDKPSARLRYVVDASYWVYLVHLPLAIAIPGLLKNIDISAALVKMPLSILVTLLVCFLSYDLFVRNSFIGEVLNGRRFDRGIPQ